MFSVRGWDAGLKRERSAHEVHGWQKEFALYPIGHPEHPASS